MFFRSPTITLVRGSLAQALIVSDQSLVFDDPFVAVRLAVRLKARRGKGGLSTGELALLAKKFGCSDKTFPCLRSLTTPFSKEWMMAA